MRSGSPLTTVGSRSVRNTAPSPARRSARSTSWRTIWSMRTSSTTSLGFAPRASSTTSPTSAVSSSSSAMMSARRLARSSSGRRSASCSTWMLARRLEIGVRSSWLASATRWRWASADCSSASSVALKLRASRASSSCPSTSRRCERSGLAVSASVWRVKRETGASAARATTRAEHGRHARCRRRRPRAGSSSSWRSERSTSVSGRATCTAPRAPRPTVSMRRWTPCTRRVGEVAAAARARRAPCARASTGSRVAAAVGDSIAPCGRDVLHLAGGVAERVAAAAARDRRRRRRPGRAAVVGRERRSRARAAPGRSGRAASSVRPRTAVDRERDHRERDGDAGHRGHAGAQAHGSRRT